MLSNRSKDTAPELHLAVALRKRQIGFRRQVAVKTSRRSVTVDFIIRKGKVAVFVDGCFWHLCPVHATWPKRNGTWWKTKLQENVRRDLRQRSALRRAGWQVLRVWAHTNPDEAAKRVARAVAPAREPSLAR